MKEDSRGVQHLINSTKNSLTGLKTAFANEAAFRQELILVAVLFSASFFLASTFIEWCILIFPLFTLLTTELLNSAIESTVDRIGSELHKLSGAAKDLASAAVFINLLFIAVVWGGYILIKYMDIGDSKINI